MDDNVEPLQCPVRGCFRRTQEALFLCRFHWARLPVVDRRRLIVTYCDYLGSHATKADVRAEVKRVSQLLEKGENWDEEDGHVS
jgi:hypothetical protein